MTKLIDLTGQKFGMLNVIARVGSTARGNTIWQCRCDCGQLSSIRGTRLTRGETQSCGCQRGGVTHGQNRVGQRTPEYGTWVAMRKRCLNPTDAAFKDYGGRGIIICDRWNSFENFLSDMGPKPSPLHSIDRFPNNDGNYEPGNCRWATAKEQANNRRPARRRAA